MAEEIAVGAVVSLKSGGPAMTVSEIYEDDGLALCVWFEDDSTEQHTFPIAGLRIIPDADIPPYRPRRR